jgi:hypothetical protein
MVSCFHTTLISGSTVRSVISSADVIPILKRGVQTTEIQANALTLLRMLYDGSDGFREEAVRELKQLDELDEAIEGPIAVLISEWSLQ